jgi:hypothetical protein
LTSLVKKTAGAVQSFATGTWVGQSLSVTELIVGTDIVVTSNSVLTIQTAGLYRVTGQLVFAAGPGSRRSAAIGSVGPPPVGCPRADIVTSSGGCSMNVTGLSHFDAGDTVTLWGFQGSGAALSTVFNSAEGGWLLVEKVG